MWGSGVIYMSVVYYQPTSTGWRTCRWHNYVIPTWQRSWDNKNPAHCVTCTCYHTNTWPTQVAAIYLACCLNWYIHVRYMSNHRHIIHFHRPALFYPAVLVALSIRIRGLCETRLGLLHALDLQLRWLHWTGPNERVCDIVTNLMIYYPLERGKPCNWDWC